MFHFTRHLVSPLAGAQFPPLNIGCLFTVHCENPVLFPKCGNISQPGQCFHPQRGATYHMSWPGSQRKREGGGDRQGAPLLWCRPRPTETFPGPQMSADNYSEASNAPGQHESPAA